MPEKRLRVLVLSEHFPNPAQPAFGIFVERQTYHLQAYCDNTVVVPLRVFPHLRLWQQLAQPSVFKAAWQQWRTELSSIPFQTEVNGLPIFYPRYTSPPKQGFYGLWGFFAYPFLKQLLHELHAEHSFDLIHAHYASPCGVIALLAQRWLHLPVVLTVHGADVTYTAKQNRINEATIRWVFSHVDRIMANSSWTKRQVEYYGGDPQKVQVVRLGANPPPRIDQQSGPIHRNSSIVLLSIGYLIERKGHAYVLKALPALLEQGYNIRYVVVGDGPKAYALQCLARELGLTDIVSFEGYKTHAEVWPYFNACDIFILPSWDEAFGVVYIEALSLGKAVIGCQGEGGPEDLRSLGDCIELAKPRDVDSLVQALKRLLDNPERRRQMGRSGQEIVQTHFTWLRTASDTMTVYRQVLEADCA